MITDANDVVLNLQISAIVFFCIGLSCYLFTRHRDKKISNLNSEQWHYGTAVLLHYHPLDHNIVVLELHDESGILIPGYYAYRISDSTFFSGTVIRIRYRRIGPFSYEIMIES